MRRERGYIKSQKIHYKYKSQGEQRKIVKAAYNFNCLANTNTHGEGSSTFVAAVENPPISKSCGVVNL